ncbi:MAG: glycosyltransferase family 2 protein [Phycisphaerae bacterium]|nr:glycosyltransferase family 2 protein [Phycisphaerae bacterium]MDW8261642.1 glycosyltransferase family 2 protein [Phycisphaerales bacterium]
MNRLLPQSFSDTRKTPPARIAVIIPAWNEEGSIGRVIDDLPRDLLHEVIVADNNSTDYTADVARKFGATVTHAPQRGYGSACLAGIDYLRALSPPQQPDIVVFLDADYSDYPDELPLVVEPILSGRADFVIGSRTRKPQPPGALLPQARFGNLLACFLMRALWGIRYTDLGPFRAIRWKSLLSLGMSDTNFGWTVEMQIKAARAGLRIEEVSVSYRPRLGHSKITGTLKGTILAGSKILWTIFRHGLRS